MGGVNENINAIIEQQIAQLGVIGSEAMKVAAKVSQTLPGIRSVVTDVATAGDAVLSTAEDLIGRAESLASSVSRYFADLDHGSIKVGILHSLSGTLTASERPLQQLLVMMIEKLNKQRRLARPSGRGGDHGSALGRQRLCGAGARAARRPQGGGDLRLLDLGLAQARAAGAGRAQRAAVLSEPVRRRGAVAARRSTPAPRRSSRRCRRSIICCTRAHGASSWSAPITSIRAPPTPSSAIISPSAASAPMRWTSSTCRSARRTGRSAVHAHPQIRRPRRRHHRHAVRRFQRAFLPRARAPGTRRRHPAGDEPVAGRGGNAGAEGAQPGRPHGVMELSAFARHAGEPRLHRRMARSSPAIPTR